MGDITDVISCMAQNFEKNKFQMGYLNGIKETWWLRW